MMFRICELELYSTECAWYMNNQLVSVVNMLIVWPRLFVCREELRRYIQEIWSTHIGKCDDYGAVGCDVKLLVRLVPMFLSPENTGRRFLWDRGAHLPNCRVYSLFGPNCWSLMQTDLCHGMHCSADQCLNLLGTVIHTI